MNRPSHNGKVTAAQRAEVIRLASEGASVRQIAAQVFGEQRFRGRVERILKGRQATADGTGDLPEPLVIDGLSEYEVFKLFFQRRLAAIAAAGGVPSMNELRNLLNVQRQLDAWRQVESLNELTRRHHPAEEEG